MNRSPSSIDLSSSPKVSAGSPWFGVSSPMDQVETAEWQQVERFLDMLVASKSDSNPRTMEQLASAFARHLTVIRQREELRIHSIRQLQTDKSDEEANEQEVARLRQELDDTLKYQVEVKTEYESELEVSRKEVQKAILEKDALNHAMDAEFAKAQQDREELMSMLHHAESEQAAVHRLKFSERERDAARLELLEAELSLAKNKVKDLEEQVETCKKELDISEKGRKEALAAATSGREECMKLQKELQESTMKTQKLDKERKVYEAAARKAAGELVTLRLRSPSPPPCKVEDHMALSNHSLPNMSSNYQHVVEMAQKFEATMGSNLDVSVGAQSGSDKATTASESKGSEKAPNSSDTSPNLDKSVLLVRSTSPTTDSDSNQTPTTSTPENTCSAVPAMQEFKGEEVMKAALELAAIARGKAEKALSMRAEERREAETIRMESTPLPQVRSLETPVSVVRTLDSMADSVPQLSPLLSPVSSPRLHHPQPQSTASVLAGYQGPCVLGNSGVPSPPAPQRHPSPQPQREASRPFASLAGALGGTRSMSNLTQARSPGPPGPSRTSPASATTAPRFPLRAAAQVGSQPMARRR